jgi:hypothetical protein
MPPTLHWTSLLHYVLIKTSELESAIPNFSYLLMIWQYAQTYNLLKILKFYRLIFIKHKSDVVETLLNPTHKRNYLFYTWDPKYQVCIMIVVTFHCYCTITDTVRTRIFYFRCEKNSQTVLQMSAPLLQMIRRYCDFLANIYLWSGVWQYGKLFRWITFFNTVIYF